MVGNPIKVLLIEDNPGDARLVRWMIEDDGAEFSLEHADRLSVGLDRLANREIDLILLDLGLPESLGLETLHKARAEAPGVPIVVLTSLDDESTGIHAMQNGAQDFLVKGSLEASLLKRSIRYAVERKRLEEQLRQALKMEAIGRLAGGIAHDFNNLLSGIIAFAEVALQELPKGSKGHQCLTQIPGLGQQAADLIGQLLAFARKVPLRRRPLDLSLLLQETGELLKRTLPETIIVDVEPGGGPVMVEADLAQAQQILLNLATNARDAMPQGGTLTLRLAPITLTEKSRGSHPERRQGAFACLTVADTGIGIPAAIREQIFDPFFTTKEASQGTGLGLASVYGIVHQHEGWLEVETAEGQGTAIHVFFPLLSRPVEAVPEAGAALPRGTETVLLVEDNPMVRELGEILLGQLDYTVLTAADGVEALATLRAHPGIALVLTDAIMPRMGAADLIPALRELDPSLRVLVATGYAPEAVHASLRHLDISGFIQKPFRRADLATAVRAALDGPVPGSP